MQDTSSWFALVDFANSAPVVYNTALVHFIDTMNGGGILMWILFLLGAVLWYALAARFAVLGFGSTSPSRNADGTLATAQHGLLGNATRTALAAYDEAGRCGGSTRRFVSVALMAYKSDLNRYSTLIKTIVIIAPLLGLLGTVIGMIETFEALQTLSIFSQGSSIAGGVSKALFTTQMGLIVAVPGLLLGRILDRKQAKLSHALQQINALILTQEQR